MRAFLQFGCGELAARRSTRSIGIAVAVGVGYFIAAWLSFGLRIPPNVIIWPAAGISAGILIWLWPVARWPVVAGMMVATVAVNLLQHFSVAATAAWVVGNTAEPLIVAALIHRYFGAKFRIDQVYGVLGLSAAAVIGAVIASTWWTGVYYWLFDLKNPAAAWSRWIIGDLAGILAVAPLVIGLTATPLRLPSRGETIESIAAVAVLAALTAVVVLLPSEAWETVIPAALVFPVLLWLAARCPPVCAAAGAFVVCITVALTAISGIGHFGNTGLPISIRVLQTQAIILAVAFGTTVLAALFAERRQAEAQLARSHALLQRERDNKLMNLQAAIASISHEGRQPLAAMGLSTATAQRFLEHVPPDLARAKSALSDVLSASGRTDEILDNIRQLFGKGRHERERIDVNEVARQALRLLSGELADHGVTTEIELAPQLPPITGHKAQLQEVIVNLVNNAMEAMVAVKGARRLTVRTHRDGGETVVVDVEDSGPGIEPGRLRNMFEAFVTTKPHGMGLGLAICQAIVEQHGGRLSASSDGRSGTRFWMSLPIESPAHSDFAGN